MQTQPQTTTLYDADFYAWTQQQVAHLRASNLDHLDIENLAEEIEALGRQEQRELRNRLGILLGHLLKWHHQPGARSKSWAATIREQRRRIQEHLAENPSLKPYLSEAIERGYQDGLDLVDRETPLKPDHLPQSCPFSTEQIFSEPLDFPEPLSQSPA